MYKQSIFAISALSMLTTSSLATDTLDDIVVSAKSNKAIQDLSGAVTVITAEDIKKTNATNIKDVLVKTAGIIESVNNASTYGRKSISIRGTESKHVLILVDGKKVNGTDRYISHSDYQYSWVPMSSIERIEIIKGPKSSIYGSQAIGGVVNIITKKTNEEFYGEVDLQMGVSAGEGGDAKQISSNIGGKVSDKLSFMINADINSRDLVSGPREVFDFGSFSYVVDPNATIIEGLESKNGSIRLNYDIDDTQSISGSFTQGEEDREEVDNPDYYKLERMMYDISYHKDFKDISFDLSYVLSESDSKFNGFSNYTHNLIDSSLRSEAQITKFENQYIVIGAETSNEDYKRLQSGSTSYDFDTTTNAYFIQDEIELGDFILTLGTRLDDHEKFGNELSPNIGGVYKLDESHRLKASYGEGFLAPTVLQGTSEYYNPGYKFHGNDDLKPESSKNYEVGYEYYGDDFVFKSAAYYNKIKDLITTEDHPIIPGDKQYTNVGKAEIKGIELEIDYDINENHMISANYNYINTEDKETGEDLAFRPENTANIGLSSEFNDGWSTYINANYVGSQYDSDNVKFSSYTQVDFQIQKSLSKQATLRLGMDNVTDKTFEDGEPYELKRRFTYVGFNYRF